MYRWNVIVNVVNDNGFVRGAEIGVAYGKNLFNVLDACPKLKMIGVDMWRPVDNVSDPGPRGLYGYPLMPHQSNRECVLAKAGDYHNRLVIMEMESTEAAAELADHSLDFVFIDACHAKEETQRDIEAWAPKVRPGGMIMGHDIHYQSVRDAVEAALGRNITIYPDDVWGIRA